jgi:catechol 2,3-dioxygenase-like lactoylglutathione lyase family enzyme
MIYAANEGHGVRVKQSFPGRLLSSCLLGALALFPLLGASLLALAPNVAQGASVARLGATSIRTPDFDEAVRWYQDKLGFRLLSTRSGVHERTALLDRGGFLLEVTEADHPMPPVPNPDPQTTAATSVPVITFLVPDVDEEVSRLKARGVDILEEPKDELQGEYRTAQIRDNGRHRIELREPLGSRGSFNPDGR